MTDLGVLPGFPSSQANAINSNGVIVGTSAVPVLDGNLAAHAIIWQNGTITDLNSLLSLTDAGAGWVLKSANGINDNGWIVGEAINTNGGSSHAFQLVPAVVRTAQVQQPINADGSSLFKASRGAIPVVFTLSVSGASTCDLPAATIAVTRTSGGTVGSVDESVYTMAADTGSNFRISDCQYVYNLGAKSLGVGTYRVDIKVGGQVAGSGVFGLR